MTVGRRVAPNYTTQSGSGYRANIDAAFAVDARFGGWFAPHQVYAGSPNPDLAVELDEGCIWNGTTLSQIASQVVGGFTIPSAGQNRVDMVVLDPVTGIASRVAGTAVTGSPTATPPSIPHGKIPICEVLLTSSDVSVTDSMITDRRVLIYAAGSIPRGHLSGMSISVSVGSPTENEITVSSGKCRNSADTGDIILSSPITKKLEFEWSVGSNAGGRDGGATGNVTWHVYVIKRSDTGVVGVCFSRNAETPDIGGSPSTIPVAYDTWRRIGSVLRVGGVLLRFTQAGDEFYLETPVTDYNGNGSSSATLLAVSVPTGVKVKAMFNCYVNNGANAIYFSDPASADIAPVFSAANPSGSIGSSGAVVGQASCWTNTSAQVRHREVTGGLNIGITTLGWVDRRGKDD